MATYFDSTDVNDLKLLRSGNRTDTELANVAALAEADVIGQYTERPPEYLYTARLGNLRNRDDFIALGASAQSEDVSNQSAPASAVVPRLRVYLLGYKANSADANVDPNLKVALKRAIAEVIDWRLQKIKREQAIASSSDGGGKNRQFAENAQDQFPPEWDRWLKPFDAREGITGW